MMGSVLLSACNNTCVVDGEKGDTITPGTPEDFSANVPNSVYFDFDKSKLSQAALDRLKAQSCWLKTYSGTKANVAGHTDVRGTSEYNMALGEARAASASRALQDLGVEGTRISTVSYGKERVIDTGTDEMSHARNRRAVTTVEP
jgi:peptidoglycan-associated lipoprotein